MVPLSTAAPAPPSLRLIIPASPAAASSVLPTIGFTEVTSDLYYQGRLPCHLKIPSIDVNVKVYEGTGSSVLKGCGPF